MFDRTQASLAANSLSASGVPGAHQLAQDRELGSGKPRLTKRRFEARFEGVGRLEDGVEVLGC